MDEWVEPEQRGFVTGRLVADNLLLFREAKWHVFATGQEATFLQLDYSKTYARLEWHFLHASLKKLGFGAKFRRWVRILCKNASTVILVNGELSKFLKLLRSVHQGCPLAPYLFVLAAYLFILMVKVDKAIQGLPLPAGAEL